MGQLYQKGGGPCGPPPAKAAYRFRSLPLGSSPNQWQVDIEDRHEHIRGHIEDGGLGRIANRCNRDLYRVVVAVQSVRRDVHRHHEGGAFTHASGPTTMVVSPFAPSIVS